MDIFEELKKKMSAYSKIEDKKVITDNVRFDDINQMKLRDYLMEIGTILEIDEKSGIYVELVKCGIGNKNPAIVGMKLKNKMLYIASYAKEGLINQRTAEKAIQKILTLVD